MSSVLRYLAVPKTTVTNVISPTILAYYDNELDEYLPVPSPKKILLFGKQKALIISE
jgi:hypothetical protein